jgi:hypothetical protein
MNLPEPVARKKHNWITGKGSFQAYHNALLQVYAKR